MVAPLSTCEASEANPPAVDADATQSRSIQAQPCHNRQVPLPVVGSRQEGTDGPRAMTGTDGPRPPDSTAVDRAVLEAIAAGRPLRDVLDVIARGLETLMPGWLVSILLVGSDGQTLHHGAAPSLPEGYVRLVDGRSAGPAAGP